LEASIETGETSPLVFWRWPVAAKAFRAGEPDHGFEIALAEYNELAYPGEKVRVKHYWQRRAPQRSLTYLLGTRVSRNFGVHDGSLANLRRGALERVLFSDKWGGRTWVTPEPCPLVLAALTREFNRRFDKLAFRVTPWTVEKFISTRGRKRAVYEKAAEVLHRRGVRESDSTTADFVKAEKLDLSSKPDPAPRVIKPRSPVYNTAVGMYISPLEPVIYKSLRRLFGSTTVIKGLNAAKQGEVLHTKWARVKDPVAVVLDLSRMDQHVGSQWLKWEHERYCKYFGSSEGIARLLSWQRHYKCVGRCHDGKIKYPASCRASGDMNTALGNCLIMCCAIWSTLFHLGILGECEVANNGDDCVVIMPRQHLALFKEKVHRYYRKFGFLVKVESVAEKFEHLDFCQTRPVFNGSFWTMVRDPRICLDKDACTLKPVRSERDWNTLRNTIGLSGLALAGHMPIFCEFYAALRRGAGERVDKDRTVTGFSQLAKGMNMRGAPVTAMARASFFSAFDITPDEQVAIERHYREIKPVWRPVLFTEPGVEGVIPGAGCWL
jgi:hypothetical protein